MKGCVGKEHLEHHGASNDANESDESLHMIKLILRILSLDLGGNFMILSVLKNRDIGMFLE